MPRPSLIERYFAQCQAHRTPPLPEFVAGLRDGVMEVNLADVSLADIRLFALAVMDTTTAINASAAPRIAGASRGPRRGNNGETSYGDASSSSSAKGSATTYFAKLSFSYDVTSARRPLAGGAARGASRGGTAAAASASPSVPLLLAPQSESTLRCLIEAVCQAVKENACSLRYFGWCGLPVQPPAHGLRANALALTQLLPLCHHLTCLRFDHVALTRAQFMQLTMIGPSSASVGNEDGGAWPALVEASFVRCDLTDACKGGIVRLIRAALPMRSAELWRQSLRSSNGSNVENRLMPRGGGVLTSLSSSRGLQRLDLSQNPLSDETARAIATALSGSVLRTLNLSNTAVTRKGAALLLLPAVLEDNVIELVDLSSTEVSASYGSAAASSPSSPSAELRLLAASSLAAGFRVVARGMGQLLVLRESMRASQQPWNVRTTDTTAQTTSVEFPAAASSTSMPSMRLEPPRGGSPQHYESESMATATSARASPEPFSGYINTFPSPQVASPMLAGLPAVPAALHGGAPVGATASAPTAPQPALHATGVSAIPSAPPPATTAQHNQQPPPAPAAAAPPPHAPALPEGALAMPPHSPHNAWWPMLASWYAMQSGYPVSPGSAASCASPPVSPYPGIHSSDGFFVPFPVPIALPIMAAMPTAAPPAPCASPTAPQPPVTSANAAVQSMVASTMAASARPAATSPATTQPATAKQTRETVTPFIAEAEEEGALQLKDTTELPDEKRNVSSAFAVNQKESPDLPDTAQSKEKQEDEIAQPSTTSGGDSHGEAMTHDITGGSSTAASTDLIRQASGAAGESKFLVALISRLEAYETDVSERLEQQYQRTTTQLTSLEKDMRFRLQQLAEAERKERSAAAERHTALMDAIHTVRDGSARTSAQDLTEEMLPRLMHLIEVGMDRVQVALEKDGVGSDAKNRTDQPSLNSTGFASAAPATTAATKPPSVVTERDLVKEANQRLKQLGW